MVWWKPRTWVRLRVVAITEREPEWTDDEYALMSAFQRYEEDLHTCGHPLSEAASALADPDNPKGEWVYKAGLPYRCHACTALEQAKAPYSGKDYDPSRVWAVEKIMR